MAFLNKLNAMKDKAIEKGKIHWDENKDGYKEKAIGIKDDVENKLKDRKRK